MKQMSVFTVILTTDEAEHLAIVRDGLVAAGVNIDKEIPEEGVLECTGPDSAIDDWASHHLVDSIRRNFTYMVPDSADEASVDSSCNE